MKRNLRRGIPAAAVAAATIAAAVLLATRPWDGGSGVQEAAATPAEYGVCNVSVSNVPPGVRVAPFPFPALEGAPWQPGKSGEVIFLKMHVPLPEGQRPIPYPDIGQDVPVESNALIDARTGDLVAEGYLTPADEAKIKSVLATLKIGPWRPTTPAWPRTDTPPKSDIAEVRGIIRTPADYDKPALKYRDPEAGSGMITGLTTASSPQATFKHLTAYTCDSIVEIDVQTGAVLQRDVAPQEEAMFQRFLGEVEAEALGR